MRYVRLPVFHIQRTQLYNEYRYCNYNRLTIELILPPGGARRAPADRRAAPTPHPGRLLSTDEIVQCDHYHRRKRYIVSRLPVLVRQRPGLLS